MQLHLFPFTAMASPCELRLYARSEAEAQGVAAAAMDEVLRIERVYSRYRDDSVTTRINRAAGGEPVEVDEETAALLDYADTAYTQSEGLFDITSGVLRRAWNFKSGRLPDPEQLEAARALVDWRKVEWSRPFIQLTEPGMEIDFGGYGKEYAADAAARICSEMGVEHGLVDLGGDLRIIGPHPDGSPWQIGIRNPRQPEQAIAAIPLLSGGLASSGDYERFMVIDGRRYCHILNPETGWPVDGALSGVSVVAPLCLLAGTAATVAMLKGAAAPAWLASLGLPHLWIDADGQLGGSYAGDS